MRYEYRIFDSDPAAAGHPLKEGVFEVDEAEADEAEADADAAYEAALIVEVFAAGLSRGEYTPGDRLWMDYEPEGGASALRVISYTLTEEDLGEVLDD